MNGEGEPDGNVLEPIDEYLSDANEYDGSIADQTGRDEVTIDDGTGSNGYGFSPAAVRIDARTTVVWEWTGEGGVHNVVDEDGAFESDYYGDAGETYEHTFDETGYTYYCDPHRASGMKGGIVVR